MNRATYLILLAGFLSLLAVAAILIIVVRAPSTADQLTLIGAIVAFLAPLITSIVALIRAEAADGKASKVQTIVTDHILNDGTTTTTPTPGL